MSRTDQTPRRTPTGAGTPGTGTSDHPADHPADHPDDRPGPPDFASLGVAEPVVRALAARGVTAPFPIQAATIPDILAGRDVCGRAKTGSGKTLAFGLGALQRTPTAEPGRPRTLILVPTRELAGQVAEELEGPAEALGVRLEAFYGGVPVDQHVAALKRGVDLLVATPGRLVDLIQRRACSVADVGIVVIDEADRMADFGFTPQVRWILRHIEGRHQTLLFSATLDGEVDHLIRDYMTDPVFAEMPEREPTVEEMQHRFLAVHKMDKARVAAAIAEGHERTLIFCATKRTCDRLCRELRSLGVQAEAIHGDLPQRLREKALERFAAGRIRALVATNVAARGIHVDDVDVVVHYDPAEDHKEYLHRSGRTARAGRSGVAVTLVLYNEELAVRILQRRLGLDEPIVEVFSNDERLARLADWVPEPA